MLALLSVPRFPQVQNGEDKTCLEGCCKSSRAPNWFQLGPNWPDPAPIFLQIPPRSLRTTIQIFTLCGHSLHLPPAPSGSSVALLLSPCPCFLPSPWGFALSLSSQCTSVSPRMRQGLRHHRGYNVWDLRPHQKQHPRDEAVYVSAGDNSVFPSALF